MATCPVCLNVDRLDCTRNPYGSYDADYVECEVCGRFVVSRTALYDNLQENHSQMTSVMRAILSHRIRQLTSSDQWKEMWTTDRIDRFFESSPRLPSPAQQATNIIRVIGDLTIETGLSLRTLPPSFSAEIGSPLREFAIKLLIDLKNQGLLEAMIMPTMSTTFAQDIQLTLAGWALYEQEQQGQLAGNYGFLALKFGDPVLDPLVEHHIKPAIREIGYELVDLRDVSKAGVIDNLLRMQIRDAAFVLVDLTHENSGAYWEAGFAEGLGKPVLYMCEKDKFDQKKTHFDTNHCTTVLWHVDEKDKFKAELVATVRRSLLH